MLLDEDGVCCGEKAEEPKHVTILRKVGGKLTEWGTCERKLGGGEAAATVCVGVCKGKASNHPKKGLCLECSRSSRQASKEGRCE